MTRFRTPSGDNFTRKIDLGQLTPENSIVRGVFFLCWIRLWQRFFLSHLYFTGLPDFQSCQIQKFGANWIRNIFCCFITTNLRKESKYHLYKSVRSSGLADITNMVARFAFSVIFQETWIWQHCWWYMATLMVGLICKEWYLHSLISN